MKIEEKLMTFESKLFSREWNVHKWEKPKHFRWITYTALEKCTHGWGSKTAVSVASCHWSGLFCYSAEGGPAKEKEGTINNSSTRTKQSIIAYDLPRRRDYRISPVGPFTTDSVSWKLFVKWSWPINLLRRTPTVPGTNWELNVSRFKCEREIILLFSNAPSVRLRKANWNVPKETT